MKSETKEALCVGAGASAVTAGACYVAGLDPLTIAGASAAAFPAGAAAWHYINKKLGKKLDRFTSARYGVKENDNTNAQ